MFHRLWVCRCLDRQRREAVGDEVVDGIVNVVSKGKHRLVFVFRGGMACPGDEHPPPLEEGSWDVVWRQDPPPDNNSQLQGKLYIDGSCSRHVVKELVQRGVLLFTFFRSR